MVKSIKYMNNIMNIIKQELKDKDHPLISRDKWDFVPKTPFTVLISCILSLRTKDEVTEEASIRLLRNHSTPKHLIKLSEEDIQKLIFPVGFYKTKARRIKDIASFIQNEYDGILPKDFDLILSLKGVGRKTANIVMVYGFNDPSYLPIDTHCHRIPNRIGWIQTNSPDETEKEIKKILPMGYWYDFNHLFVIFGQTICVPVSPFCSKCPISKYCEKRNVKKQR